MNNKSKSISHRSFGFRSAQSSWQPSITAAPDCRYRLNVNYTFRRGAQLLGQCDLAVGTANAGPAAFSEGGHVRSLPSARRSRQDCLLSLSSLKGIEYPGPRRGICDLSRGSSASPRFIEHYTSSSFQLHGDARGFIWFLPDRARKGDIIAPAEEGGRSRRANSEFSLVSGVSPGRACADQIGRGNLGKTFDREIEDGNQNGSMHECRVPPRPISLSPGIALLPCLRRTSYHSLPQVQSGPRRNERSVGESM